MGFYFGIFGGLAIFSLLELLGLKKTQDAKLFLCFSLLMFILSFIRWETGTDWINYYSFFQRSNDWFLESEFEWGFSRLNEFVNIFFGNYNVLLFVLAIVLFIFQTTAIYRLSPYPITSLFFLWSVSFGNVLFIRQTVSTVILLYSVNFIIERKFYKFIFCILFAMIFHRSSIIFLPAWWIYKLNIRSLWLWIGVAVSVLFTAGVKILIEFVAGSLGPVIQSKIDIYLADSETTFGTAASLTQIIIKGVANKILIFLLLMCFYRKISSKYTYFGRLVNLYWFGILLYFATIGISIALVRFSYAYDILQIILVVMIFQFIENVKVRVCFFVVFLFYLAARLYIALVGGYYDLFVPYKTIFN